MKRLVLWQNCLDFTAYLTVSTDLFLILSIFVATEACLIFVNFGSLPHALSSPLKRYAKKCVNLRQYTQNEPKQAESLRSLCQEDTPA